MPSDIVSRLTRPFAAQGPNRRWSRHALRAFTSGAVAVTLCAGLIGSAPSAQATNAITLTPSSPTVAPGSTVTLTAAAPIAQAGSTTQEITQTIDPTKVRLTAASDITYPAGWTLSYCSGAATDCSVAGNFSATTPASSAAWAAVKAVKATGTIDSQGESAGRQVAQATVSGGAVAQTPTTLPSSGVGLDGFRVFFDPARTRVFNVYHHTSGRILDCYVVLSGQRCAGFPFDYGGRSEEAALGVVVGSTAWIHGTGGLYCVDLAAVLANSSNTVGGGAPTRCFGSSALVSLKAGSVFTWFTGASALGQSAETKLYALDTTSSNAMVYCVDTATRAPCSTPTLNPQLPGIGTQPFDTSNIFQSGDLLYVLVANNWVNPATERVTCIRISTGTKCPGWTTDDNYSSAGSKEGRFIPIPTTSGGVRAVCYFRATETSHKCWEPNGTQTFASAYNFPNFSVPSNAGPTYAYGVPAQIGSRVYYSNSRYGNSATGGEVICYDAAANGGAGGRCNGATANLTSTNNYYRSYTVTPDPVIANCLWVTQHANPVFLTVNILTGELGCSAIAPQRTTFSGATAVPRMGCSATSAIQEWASFTLDTPTSGFTSAKLTVQNSSGTNITGWTDVPLTPGVDINLSTLLVSTTGQTPNFLVDFLGISGSLTATARIKVIGDSPQLCTRVTAVTVCPVALGPVDSAALLPGTLNATGSGSSTASGVTTPFTSDSETVAISAPTAAQCGSTLTGRAGDATLGSAGSPVPGVTVSLLDGSGVAVTYPSDYSTVALRGLPITQTTSASGTYSFGYLTPGSYKVSFPTTGTATSTSATVVSGAAGSLLTTTTAVSGTSTSAVDVLVVGTNGVVNGLYVIAAAATADLSTGRQGTAQTITPLSNDTASTGATYSGGSTALRLCGTGQTFPNCTATSLVVSGQGSYSISGTTMTFTPCSGVNTPVMTPACTGAFTGVASAVNYQSTDSLGRTATSTVTPTVVPVPVATADTSTGAWNTPQSITPLSNDLRGSAYDTSHPLLASTMGICVGGTTLVSDCTSATTLTTADGTYVLNRTTGAVTFTPSSTFAGVVTEPIKYSAADSLGQRTMALITPTVTPPPPPTAASETKLVQPGSSVTFTTVTGAGGLGTSGGPPLYAASSGSSTGLCPAGTVLPGQVANCTLTSLSVAGEGTYSLNRASGLVTYTALAGATSGSKTPVTYVIRDRLTSGGRTNWASATLTPVIPGPPVATDDTATGAWDTNQVINVVANDSASPGTSLTNSSVRLCTTATADASCTGTSLTIANQGTYTVNTSTGAVTFDPLPTFSGTATPIKYVITQSDGLTDSATITPTVTAPTAPVAADESQVVLPGGTVAFTTLDRSGGLTTPGQPALVPASTCLIVPGSNPATCDSDGIVTIAGEGTYTLNSSTGVVSFAADANATSGNKTPVTYRVTDAFGNSDTGALTPRIPASPTSNPDSSRGEVNTVQTVAPTGNDAAGLASVPLVPTSVKICAVTSPQTACTGTSAVDIAGKGTFTVNLDGTVAFTPLPDVAGISTVAYTVADSEGRTTTNTITVTVLPKPAPSAVTDRKSAIYGQNVVFTPLTETGTSDSPGSQPANITGGPTGSRTGSGEVSTVESVQSIAFGAMRLCAANESPPSCTQTSVTTNDGTYALSGTTVTFTPAPGFTGQATTPVQYQVANSVTRVTTTTTIQETTTDPTGSCTAPSCTVEQINDADGTAPNGVGGNGTYTPTWRVTTVGTSTVAGTPETAAAYVIPTINAPAPITADPETDSGAWNTAVSENVTVGDTSGATIDVTTVRLCGPLDTAPNCTQTSMTIADQGTYSVDTSTGVVTFTPLQSFSGTATPVTYSVRDGLSRKASSTYTPTIAAPAPPTASNEGKNVLAGASVSFTTIAEAGALTAPGSVGSLSDGGACLLTPGTSTCDGDGIVATTDGVYELNPVTGVVTYTANSTAPSGPQAPVSYRVIDSLGLTATAVLTPTVYDRPTVQAKTVTDLVNTAQTFAALVGDTFHAGYDPTASSVRLCDPRVPDVAPNCSVTALTVAGEGVYSVDTSTGIITFTPDSGYTGMAQTVTYSVTDGLGQKASNTLSPVVVPLPTPSAVDDEQTGNVGNTLTFVPSSNDSAGSSAAASVTALALTATSVRLCGTAPAETPPNCTQLTVTTNDGTYVVDPATGSVTFTGDPSFAGRATNPVRYQISNAYTANGTAGSATTSALLIPTLTRTQAPGNGGGSSSDLPAEPQPAATDPTGTRVPSSAPAAPAPNPVAPAPSGPVLVPQQAVTVVDPDKPAVLDPLADAVPSPGERFRPGTVRIWDGDSWVRSHAEPGVGTWTVVDGRVEFMPAPGFTGTAKIRVKATDTAGEAARAMLRVKVTPRAGGPVSRPAGARPGLVPSVIDAGIQARAVSVTGRECPGVVGGRTVAWITVAQVTVPIKAVSMTEAGVLAPPDSAKVAAVSTQHASLDAAAGTSVLTWHARFGAGCEGDLNVLLDQPVGSTFTITTLAGQATRYRITDQVSVAKGRHQAAWFAQTGPRRLTLLTCDGLTGNRFTRTAAIFATPLPPT